MIKLIQKELKQIFIKVSNEEEKDYKSESSKTEINVEITGDMREDIQNFSAADLGVDNDIEATPENNQRMNNQQLITNQICAYQDQTDNIPGVCTYILVGYRFEKAKLVDRLNDNTRLQCFLRFLPENYIKETIIPETNKMLRKLLSFGEFFRYISVWVLIICFPRVNIKSFFSVTSTCSMYLGQRSTS